MYATMLRSVVISSVHLSVTHVHYVKLNFTFLDKRFRQNFDQHNLNGALNSEYEWRLKTL